MCVCVCVCVCVRACVRACMRMRALACSVNECSLNLRPMSTEHSVSPEPSAYTKSTMSTEHSVSGELSALTKPTYRAFRVLPSTNIPLSNEHSIP